MKSASGDWIGLGLGDIDPKITDIKQFMKRMYASYAGDLDESPVFNERMEVAVKEMQQRLVDAKPPKLKIEDFTPGILNYKSQVAMKYIKVAPKARPCMFTVEGHLSNMLSGPCADTANILEKEELVNHLPTGYDCGSVPFNNDSGVVELARRVGQTVQDNGVPFPAGTPFVLSGFSQGDIVVFDFYNNYLQPGQLLEWRAKDLVCVLEYGPPTREMGNIAPWAMPWVKNQNTHGLDPYRRFGLPGFPKTPDNWVSVYREGDIFAQNGDDKASEVKAAVYQAVARGDFFSDPFSLVAQISDLFTVPFDEVMAMFWAIVSGVGFLATNPNPHYSPYDITGGLNYVRNAVKSAVALKG